MAFCYSAILFCLQNLCLICSWLKGVSILTDHMTKEQRTKAMMAVKSKSKLEDIISKKLWSKNIRFRKNVKGMMGTPDVAIKKYKIVIFVDSCFWHFCPQHGTIPKSNFEFWKKKLEANRARDSKVTNYYINKNWTIIRIWEHEMKNDLEFVVDNVVSLIEKEKNRYNFKM